MPHLTMRHIVYLFAFIISVEARCPGVLFNGRYYNVEVLKEGVNKIHQLVLNKKDNTLYFIYDQIASVPTGSLGYLDIETRESGLIDGVRNATSVTVDPRYNTVYVGGADGIYVINSNRAPEILPIRDSIQSVYFKDVLYYTNTRNEAYSFEHGYIDRLYELDGVEAEKLIIDDDNNMFFTIGKNLYRIKLGTRAVNTHETYKVDVMAVDGYLKPYIGTGTGVYVYNKYKFAMDKVSNLNNIRGLTFNKRNEPIYAILDAIYKLNATTDKCFES